MQASFAEVREGSAALAEALASARSARNLISRKRAEDEQEERKAESLRRRMKRKADWELEQLLRARVGIKVREEDRPKIGTSTARKLYHRTASLLLGGTGLTDARGPDGLYSIHFAFTARGFASTTGRRWRRGEAERAARYIVREDGLEGGEHGWWSNIANDRNELVAFFRALEALERHDRSNANVYVSEIIALPAELTARQRRRAVRRICRFFEQRGLAYTVAIHLPDSAGDQRNFHCHILYSLRPCLRLAPFEWSFAASKEQDINTPQGIKGRRVQVVQDINATLCAAGIAKRYTPLSNKARRMAAAQGKVGQQLTWAARRLEALEAQAALLERLGRHLQGCVGTLQQAGARLSGMRGKALQHLASAQDRLETTLAKAEQVPAALKGAAEARLAAAVVSVGAGAVSRGGRIGSLAVAAATALKRTTALVGAAQHLLQARLDGVGRVRHLLQQRAGIAEIDAAACRRMGASRTAAAVALDCMQERLRPEGQGSELRLLLLGDTGRRLAKADALSAELTRIASGARERLAACGRRASVHLTDLRTQAATLAQTMFFRRVALAGLGEIASLREERRRWRDRREAATAVLEGHQASLVRVRLTVATMLDAAATTMRTRPERACHRLEQIVAHPQLRRPLELLVMSDQLRGGDAGRPARGQRHAEVTQARLSAISFDLASVTEAMDARLRRVGSLAADRTKSVLDVGRRFVEQALDRSAGRLTAGAVLAAGWLDRQGRVVQASVDGVSSRLAKLRDTSESREAVFPEQRPLESRAAAEIARLREIARTRLPETDLSGQVPPTKDPLALAERREHNRNVIAGLRSEASRRERQVRARLLEQALRRLSRTPGAIRVSGKGLYEVDERCVLDEERRVLRDPAHQPFVQGRLAEIAATQQGILNVVDAAATPPADPQKVRSEEVSGNIKDRVWSERRAAIEFAVGTYQEATAETRDAVSATMGTVAASLSGTLTTLAARLERVSSSPRLQRQLELKAMEDHLARRSMGASTLLQPLAGVVLQRLSSLAEERARITETIAAVSPRIAGVAALTLSSFDAHVRTMQSVQSAGTRRAAAAVERMTGLLDRDGRMLADVLEKGTSRLGKAGETTKGLAQAGADGQRVVDKGADLPRPPVEKQEPAQLGAEERRPVKAQPGGSASAARAADPPTSGWRAAIVRLRDLARTRPPETDLGGATPSVKDRATSAKAREANRQIINDLRSEVRRRGPSVSAELLKQSLRRIELTPGAISVSMHGVYEVNRRCLLDEERRVIGDPTNEQVVQAALAKIWAAQQAQRHAPQVASAGPGTSQDDLERVRQQMAEIARRNRKGR